MRLMTFATLPTALSAGFLAIALAMPIAPAAAGTPVRVTRFHLGTPITPAPIAIQSGVGNDPQSLEQQQFATAVAAELERLGFARPVMDANGASTDAAAPLLATVTVKRESRDETAPNKPVQIGLGGGGFGGSVGGGIGVGFGVGKRATRTFYMTELFVQIRRRVDGGAIWEGRALMEVNARAKDAQPNVMINKLTRALFLGFPGQSGRTITVK
ncbi:MAG: DUF4136 domain-containing protein [Sphingomonas sp.]|uniref:DUF4136 domain-containing protein n=1 Tax=Sphingomonas sp. TaxID=28214 RepID=UPI0035A93910|nr:DUF4136 domain-containing protein [Sphingomonas sp.]